MAGQLYVATSFRATALDRGERNAFGEMHADPAVMMDQGGPFDRAASDAKFDRCRDAWQADGISRWVIADGEDRFLGYAGVTKRSDPDHPLGTHFEIGWRLRRSAWGKGYATESARYALSHAWGILDVAEIVSYTDTQNQRSQNVMRRLDLRRDASRDFTARYPRGVWAGLMWVAERPIAGYRPAQ
jgi:RimJ/RimL family protein N-acetyltransferase